MQEDTLKPAMPTASSAETSATKTKQTTAVIIANPTSGSYQQSKQQIEETLVQLRKQGWQADLRLTQNAGDARRLAKEAVAQKCDIAIAFGGDGTINEIIQELAGSETTLGILPSGTVNVWARETGIPLDVAGARKVLLQGQTRRIDLGYTPGHYFMLMAGIGLDGEITHAVEKKPAKRFGVLGYLLIGTWLGLGYPSFRATLDVDGQTVKVNALQIIVGNTQLYGGAIKYTWHAKCDDGLLDVCVVKKQTVLGRIATFADFLLRREQRKQWVRYFTCTALTIHTRQPVAMQIDGDPKGYINEQNEHEDSATTFHIVPGALKVIVPQKTPEDIFS